MRIFRGTDDLLPERFRRPVVTIGVFDGLHRGHRALLARGREMAARAYGELVVLTFNVHPRAVTNGQAPPLITSLPHRLHLLAREGVDTTVVLHFDQRLREVPAEQFVDDVLVARIGVRGVALGYDSHFGHNRSGGFELLARTLEPRGIPVRATEPVTLTDGTVVSSTAIREAVARGDLEGAARLLGRQPALYGAVVRGDGRGHALGFPTANLDLGGELRPDRGVYGGFVTLEGGNHAVLVNVGRRPTFHTEEGAPSIVEAHVLDFEGDLYGRTLEVFLLGHIRGEQRFDDADALKAQIARDAATLREHLETGRWRLR